MANEKNFDLMKNITKSASMTEATIIKEKTTKGAGGRPKVANKQDKKVTVNFTEEELQKIEELAEAKMVSKSQLIRILLAEAKAI